MTGELLGPRTEIPVTIIYAHHYYLNMITKTIIILREIGDNKHPREQNIFLDKNSPGELGKKS